MKIRGTGRAQAAKLRMKIMGTGRAQAAKERRKLSQVDITKKDGNYLVKRIGKLRV